MEKREYFIRLHHSTHTVWLKPRKIDNAKDGSLIIKDPGKSITISSSLREYKDDLKSTDKQIIWGYRLPQVYELTTSELAIVIDELDKLKDNPYEILAVRKIYSKEEINGDISSNNKKQHSENAVK